MIAPIDWSRIETALTTPAGWADLALTAACLALAFAVDRRVNIRSEHASGVVRAGIGGIDRVVFPLTALILLAVASAAYGRVHPPFFLHLARPLVGALALIRLLVYALHGVFGTAAWLKTSERAISFSIWGLVVLCFLGVLPEVGAELDTLTFPLGRGHVSVLEIGKGALVVLLTIATPKAGFGAKRLFY